MRGVQFPVVDFDDVDSYPMILVKVHCTEVVNGKMVGRTQSSVLVDDRDRADIALNVNSGDRSAGRAVMVWFS
jgi:hypothetical protein